MLRITRTIKGTPPASGDVPVTLDYGITADVSGPNHDPPATTQPIATTGPVAVFDTAEFSIPIVDDVRRPTVWLLRRGDDQRYHVKDPPEVRPALQAEYVACYLAADPESAVRAYVQRQPSVAEDAVRYLSHCEVRRIAGDPDPARRAERLLPYLLARHHWAASPPEVETALIGCGAAAGPYLLAACRSTADAGLCDQEIGLLGQIRYAPATDFLVGVIEQGGRCFAGDPPTAGWWNQDVDSELNRLRRDQYGRAYAAVIALGQIGEPRTLPALRAARAAWATIPDPGPQMVAACDQAVAAVQQPDRSKR